MLPPDRVPRTIETPDFHKAQDGGHSHAGELEHVPPKACPGPEPGCEAVWRSGVLQHIDQVLVLFGGMIPSRRDAR